MRATPSAVWPSFPRKSWPPPLPLEPADHPDGDLEPGASPSPHILDDGVAEAEASDHLDADAGETEMEEN